VIPSCVLGQHNATSDVLIGIIDGIGGTPRITTSRTACAKEVDKQGNKIVSKALKLMSKCIDKQMKAGTVGDLSPICVGSHSTGTYTPPSDTKTADKIDTLIGKAEDGIDDKCSGLGLEGPIGTIADMFACPDAETTEDVKDCLRLAGQDGIWSYIYEILAQQYSEAATNVTNGPGNIGAAVAAASDGDKLLIEPGDYAEEIAITTDNLSLVGCGGASGNRPRIIPDGGPTDTNGVFAANVDGLHFQSLELFDWDENGIFVTGAQGVSFRDIIGDGNNFHTVYAVFPVVSDDVLIETSYVKGIVDAGIYVGQSTNIVVRYNRVEDNVAGIEIENSSFARVHNNYATNNTGGLLVFKLPSPPVQLGDHHNIFHNVNISNNEPNVGSGTVGLVPAGTGMIVISTQDSDFHHNWATTNQTFGFAMLDQIVINVLAAPTTKHCNGGTNDGNLCTVAGDCPLGTCDLDPLPFDPLSPDQTTHNNTVRSNNFIQNGGNPHSPAPFGATLFHGLGDELGGDHNNCFTANAAGGGAGQFFFTPNDCTP
jgi:parallel beta-helix repeat protein